MKTQDKGGRPVHAPDDRSRQMVEVLSGFGIPQEWSRPPQFYDGVHDQVTPDPRV